jgi:hypothetical protein
MTTDITSKEVPPVPYPSQLSASLDPGLSRWLWLVKWLLALPHYLVLAFLWVAVLLVSVVAFFAVLFTRHYPRPLFDFTVGVLRWSWRVEYYSYGALATDRYPPFSLTDAPDYPAHLEVAYPEDLSRGLVLVKWWLLAIPHFLVLGIIGGGMRGLTALLTLFAGIALLFTGTYPRGIFDLVVGLNRWALRVAAYTALLRDEYPPFRLDQGGAEPA